MTRVLIWLLLFLAVGYIVVFFWQRDADWIGNLEVLFSGLGLFFLAITVLLQIEELRLQRQELQDTRLELAKAAAAQEKSQIALNRQINSMVSTALLSGHSAMYAYHQERELKTNINSPARQLHRDKATESAKKIQDLIADLEVKFRQSSYQEPLQD